MTQIWTGWLHWTGWLQMIGATLGESHLSPVAETQRPVALLVPRSGDSDTVYGRLNS